MKKLFIVGLLTIILVLNGCSENNGALIHRGIDEEWSIELPENFQREKEEEVEGLHITTYVDDNGNKLTISEVEDKDYMVNEDFFENEFGEDSYFHVDRKEVLDIENFGKVYGVIGDEHSTNGSFIYYKTRVNDKVISFVVFKATPFTEVEESKIKTMISKIKPHN